jgi:hypothetical protein
MRPDQQQAYGVLAVLDKYTVPELRQARDAVAEYITANDEYDLMLAVKVEAIRHGAELYKMAAIDKDIQKATERRALAHACTKGRRNE